MTNSNAHPPTVPDFDRTLFENLSAGVVFQGVDGTAIAANAAALTILDLTLDQLQGRVPLDYAWDLVDERGVPIPRDQHPSQVALRTGRPVRDLVIGVRTPRRRDTTWLNVTAIPHIPSPGGEPTGVVFTLDDVTQRVSHERQLRLWVDAFQHCSHGIAIGIPGTDRLRTCNAALAESRGRTIDEMTQMSVLETYLPADRDQVGRAMAEADRVGSSKVQARIARPDGVIRTIEMDIVSVRDDKGALAYRVATQLDVTERTQAELKNSQLYRLYATLSQVNQTIVRVTSEEELFEAACRLAVEFGEFRLAWIGLYDPANGVVSPVAASKNLDLTPISILEGDHREGLIGMALRTGAITHSSGARADAARPWGEPSAVDFQACAVVPLRRNQQIVGLLALYAADASFFSFPEEVRLLEEMGLDLSHALDSLGREAHRLRAEASLIASEAALKRSQAVAHVGHWSWDTRTNQLTWSNEMHRIFGVQPSETLDLDSVIARAIHPDDRAIVQQANENVIADQTPVTLEYRVVWADGSVHTVWAQPGEAVYDTSGAIVRLTGIVQDITARKQAETKIHDQAERLRILAEASRAFASVNPDDRAVLEQVAQQVAEALNGNCHIRLLAEDGQQLELVAVHDRDEAMQRTARVLLDATLVRVDDTALGTHVVAHGQSILLPTTTPDELLPHMLPALRPLMATFPVHSVIAAPLTAQGQRLGVIVLLRYRSDQPAFDSEDLRLLQDLADRAALAIINARLFGQLQQELTEHSRSAEALRESEARLKTVFEATPDAVFITDPDGSILDVNPVAAERYGYSRDEMLQMTARDFAPAGLEDQALSDLSQALIHGLPVERLSRRKDGSELQEEVILRPFVLEGRACVLASVRDISERIQVQQRAQLQLQRLKALRTIDVMITSNLDIRLTLDVLLDQVTAQLNVDAAAILLFNESLQTLEFAAGRGFRSRAIEQTQLRLGQGTAGQAGLERRLIVLPNLRQTGAAGFVRSGLLASDAFAAYAGVPLVAKGRLVGVLEVFHRTPLDPDLEWRDFLETLAGQAAIALDDAHLFSDLQRSNTELRLAYDATIEGWSRAMDLRDKETEGHTQRVTELTLILAQAAGMTSDQIAHVRRGALLHDIGKLGVPDSILLKDDSLSEEEWAMMRLHPQYAYDMLSSIDYLRPALDIPYCHHEKWDGTGYPRGLKGEQIPLAARIFMVADVWDALRSDRPYRASWSKEEVEAHIREQSGVHFDPKAVELFFQVLHTRVRAP